MFCVLATAARRLQDVRVDTVRWRDIAVGGPVIRRVAINTRSVAAAGRFSKKATAD